MMIFKVKLRSSTEPDAAKEGRPIVSGFLRANELLLDEVDIRPSFSVKNGELGSDPRVSQVT